MDEMNMNETTVMENETSVEVVPEENVQVMGSEETSSTGSGFGLAVGGVALGAAVVYGMYRKHKAKKEEKAEQKPKTKKKFHLRTPWTVEEVVVKEETVDKDVEETSEEEE